MTRAFCDVFEDCSLWTGFGTDLDARGYARRRGRRDRGSLSRSVGGAARRGRAHGARLRATGAARRALHGRRAYLRQLTAEALPVVDDFPRRITPPPFFSSYNESGGGLYGEWPNAAAARQRFEKSALIAKLWPPAMRDKSLEYFPAQALLSKFAYRSSLRLSDNMVGIHQMSTTMALKTPFWWMLGSDGDVLRILAKLSPAELEQPAVAYSRRVSRFLGATLRGRCHVALQGRRGSQMGTSARVLRVYALFMAGQRVEAQAALVEARQRLAVYSSATQLLARIERTFPD